jgi:1,4-dihydroxy-2-naphthoate octaprenyltransferase
VPEAAGESVTESPIAAEPVTESVAIERVTEAAAAKPAAAKPAASAVPPEPADAEPVEPEPAGVHARTSAEDGLTKLAEYKRAVLSWVAEDGYPVNVDVEIEVKLSEGTVRFAEPAGFKIPAGTLVAVTGSHIHALPEGGFDRRRHVTVWGPALVRPRGRFAVSPSRVWSWNEGDTPLPAAYERNLPKARRYFDALSAERGELVRPTLPRGLLLLRATRAPFLSATLAPVLLGLAVAARVGVFDIFTAVITLVAASAVHLGLNVANDVFDTMQGADDANPTPTKFSGGSRVLQNALVTMREMSLLAICCYGVAAALGVLLLILRPSPALLVIAALGFFISVAYTMPPFKLVYRGLGELSTAIGFGPVMLLGTYAVQSRGSLSTEAFLASVPLALLVAMILYVNEIPDRAGDAKAGKLTLPVRWSKAAVIAGFDVSAGGSFVVVVGGVAAGLLPIPTLLVLLAVPLALRVHSGLDRFYDNPYALMDTMGTNIKLHMTVGGLLLVGYLLTIADQTILSRKPFFW